MQIALSALNTRWSTPGIAAALFIVVIILILSFGEGRKRRRWKATAAAIEEAKIDREQKEIRAESFASLTAAWTIAGKPQELTPSNPICEKGPCSIKIGSIGHPSRVIIYFDLRRDEYRVITIVGKYQGIPSGRYEFSREEGLDFIRTMLVHELYPVEQPASK